MAEVTNNMLNPTFSMMKPPAAGPAMPVSDGITEVKRPTILARAFDPAKRNWRRL
jgi:hypothetical protein